MFEHFINKLIAVKEFLFEIVITPDEQELNFVDNSDLTHLKNTVSPLNPVMQDD